MFFTAETETEDLKNSESFQLLEPKTESPLDNDVSDGKFIIYTF